MKTVQIMKANEINTECFRRCTKTVDGNMQDIKIFTTSPPPNLPIRTRENLNQQYSYNKSQ